MYMLVIVEMTGVQASFVTVEASNESSTKPNDRALGSRMKEMLQEN